MRVSIPAQSTVCSEDVSRGRANQVGYVGRESLAQGGGAMAVLEAISPTAKPIDPAMISDDAFFGLSITEAAKKYLGMVKRKQTVREIADALDRGGLPHTSSNFVATVATMLRRA